MPHPQSKRAKAAKAKRAEGRRQITDADRLEEEEAKVARADRRAKSDHENLRQKQRNKVRTGLMWGASILVIGLVGWWLLRPGAELDGVEQVSNAGRGHVTNASYTDNEPTSGAHSSSAPPCATYPTPLQLDLAVHALEHGVVVLWYQQGQSELAAELEAATERWDSHVIISPNASQGPPIVATAWNRRASYTDAAEVTAFVDTYRERGPENVRCERQG